MLVSLGIFSVVVFLLVDLAKQPGQLISNTTERLTESQNTDSGVNALMTHLNYSAIMRTGLVDCHPFSPDFWHPQYWRNRRHAPVDVLLDKSEAVLDPETNTK